MVSACPCTRSLIDARALLPISCRENSASLASNMHAMGDLRLPRILTPQALVRPHALAFRPTPELDAPPLVPDTPPSPDARQRPCIPGKALPRDTEKSRSALCPSPHTPRARYVSSTTYRGAMTQLSSMLALRVCREHASFSPSPTPCFAHLTSRCSEGYQRDLPRDKSSAPLSQTPCLTRPGRLAEQHPTPCAVHCTLCAASIAASCMHP